MPCHEVAGRHLHQRRHVGLVADRADRAGDLALEQRARRHKPRALLEGEIPSPIRVVGDEPEVPPLVQVAPGHFVARHAIGGAF